MVVVFDFNPKVQKSRRQNLRQQNWKKYFATTLSFCELKDQKANSVDSDEVAHYEPPHLDLHCLQIKIFSLILVFTKCLVTTSIFSYFCLLEDVF